MMMAEIVTEHQLRIVGFVQVDQKLHLIFAHIEIVQKDGIKMTLSIQLYASRNEVMVMKVALRNETMGTLKMGMGEIVTEHQLRIGGYVEVDQRLRLILVKVEMMDIIKTTLQILNTEFQDVEMVI